MLVGSGVGKWSDNGRQNGMSKVAEWFDSVMCMVLVLGVPMV